MRTGPTNMPVSVYFFLMIQLFFVAYNDFKNKKISNVWPIINIALYFAVVFFFPTQYKINFETFIFPLAFFFVGIILFMMKIMGAGDSKFLLSFYLLIPLEMHEQAFIFLAYSTVVVGLSLLFTNIFKNLDTIIVALKTKNLILIKGVFGQRFSYAPVILVSWLWFGWTIKEKIYF
ncbi:prepilin peptidase [Halobacteriovorax sp. HLS]|uniref:prepilin peptidase n=1 Tax=Halobacteriovorax sp. HLS TaxID=2234000 RepID=UPI000FD9B479|nr:prepilin peptidase [Halobacteriovorax sp. HLS]